MKRLAGKSALVTGAARGIGFGFAERYLAEGATVAIADINLSAAKEAAAALGAGAYAVQLDVSDQASIDAAIAAVVAQAGKLDILINNAALFDAAETVDITRASYDKLYAVNVAGTLFTMQAAARQMIAQGHGGKIINMASQAGRRGESLVLVYCSTKAAVISMTQSAGLNLIKHGINVNAIAPGYIDTDMVAAVPAPVLEKIVAKIPVGRLGQASEIARAVAFLVSEEAGFITGSTMSVNGGQHMY